LFEQYPEILTVNDLGKMLQLSRSQCYDLTRNRGQVRHEHPIPVLRIATNLRFRKSDVITWLDKLSQQGKRVLQCVVSCLLQCWRAGRVVEGIRLESGHTRKGIGGSNPSLSAIITSKNLPTS
jgi:predicted DNA-binding transcriptional regulator AlpA